MAKKRYTPEQIVAKIREADVELTRGQTTPQVCKKLGVSEQTHYRWRRVYEEQRLEQARRLKAPGTGKQSVEEAGGRPGDRHCDFEGSVFGKILSPD